jgi:hypothetical protein
MNCVRYRIKAIEARLNEFKKLIPLIVQQNQTISILIRKTAERLKELGIVKDPHSICAILSKELGDITSPRTIRDALSEEFKSIRHSQNAKKQRPHTALLVCQQKNKNMMMVSTTDLTNEKDSSFAALMPQDNNNTTTNTTMADNNYNILTNAVPMPQKEQIQAVVVSKLENTSKLPPLLLSASSSTTKKTLAESSLTPSSVPTSGAIPQQQHRLQQPLLTNAPARVSGITSYHVSKAVVTKSSIFEEESPFNNALDPDTRGKSLDQKDNNNANSLFFFTEPKIIITNPNTSTCSASGVINEVVT